MNIPRLFGGYMQAGYICTAYSSKQQCKAAIYMPTAGFRFCSLYILQLLIVVTQVKHNNYIRSNWERKRQYKVKIMLKMHISCSGL